MSGYLTIFEKEIRAMNAVKTKDLDFTFPKDFVFSKFDWIDLFYTLVTFKKRVMKRRKLEQEDK